MTATTLERVAEWAVPGLDPDPGPMARLEAVKANENTPSVVFQRLTDMDGRETLKDIAKAWQVPVGRFTEWFTTEHSVLYETALRARADQLAHEALGIADSADKETVGPAKLQVDTRLRLAGHWDKNRYGAAKEQAAAGITVLLDPSCGGSVSIEAGGHVLKIEKRSAEASEKVIQGEQIGDHSG